MTKRTFPSKAAREVCEALLKFNRDDRIEKSILPTEVEVIDRLLERGLELEGAYDELHSKLGDYPPAMNVFFDQLLSVAAFWSPDANQEARKGKSRLNTVNRDIVKAATALAALLDERTELNNTPASFAKRSITPWKPFMPPGRGITVTTMTRSRGSRPFQCSLI